ncbi:hypothetical protein Dsin_022476 [Dipteronia sinensis]|uniref:Reverse transcriptase domain-containing protein n=1 Tax=Dipteronia sinensis TaxID=43782 RepID=A0AAE0DZZ1_9ROSI|nr:hypothetical protein Dsin_022476 [Dipteronia sinensis]
MEVMEAMGFGAKWQQWIKWCIASPSLSVLVNGSPTKQFQMERGLRQGDPLSPFLFNMVVQVLSSMLDKAKWLGLIRGKGYGNDRVHITHLQFADDTVLFLEPKMEFLMNSRRILRCFELLSGLKINFHKSCLVRIGRNASNEVHWAAAFRCVAALLPIFYLGLPLGGNSSREKFLEPIIKKVEQRLAPWKRAYISKGGRLVLIKAVLSSLPSYFMSVFSIPMGVAKKIEKIQRNFFWNDGVLNKKTHAVDWVTLCKNKHFGGLGIGRVKEKGVSMMVKWIWRFGREEDSLWRKFLCAKYKLDSNLIMWDVSEISNGSQFVKALSRFYDNNHRVSRFIKQGFQIVIGSGNRTRLWHDIRWDQVPLKVAFPRIFALASNKNGVILELGSWAATMWNWDVKLRRSLFNWEIDQWNGFKLVLENIKLRNNIQDALAWHFCPNGIFSVSSFRRCLEENGDHMDEFFPFIWKGICPPKIEVFTWQLLKGRLMVREVLRGLALME